MDTTPLETEEVTEETNEFLRALNERDDPLDVIRDENGNIIPVESKDGEDEDDILGLDEPDPEEFKFWLVTKNGEKLECDRRWLVLSKLVATALEQDTESKEMPILAVDLPTLTFVWEYMKHHAGVAPPCVEKPLKSKNMEEVVQDKWDADFIERVNQTGRKALYDIILAANYMDIASLLSLGCAKVASLIKSQPLEKIPAILEPGPTTSSGNVAATSTST